MMKRVDNRKTTYKRGSNVGWMFLIAFFRRFRNGHFKRVLPLHLFWLPANVLREMYNARGEANVRLNPSRCRTGLTGAGCV